VPDGALAVLRSEARPKMMEWGVLNTSQNDPKMTQDDPAAIFL